MSVIITTDSGAAEHNIIADQNATFRYVFVWQDSDGNAINVTGYDAYMKVRKMYPSTMLTAAYSDAAVIDISNASEITVTGLTGTFDITVSSTIMSAIAPGIYNYDLLIDTGSEKTVIVRGYFEIRQGATDV